MKIEGFGYGLTVAEARQDARNKVFQATKNDLVGSFTWGTVELDEYEEHSFSGTITRTLREVGQPFTYYEVDREAESTYLRGVAEGLRDASIPIRTCQGGGVGGLWGRL